MKYFLFLLIVYISFRVNSPNSLVSKLNLGDKDKMIENCDNPCLSCQNTLYFLKFRGNSECRFNRCPGLCMSLSGQWHSNRNSHLNIFKSDQINICEACFRSNHCHINDCILEKTIVHNAITHATEKFIYHYLNPNSAVFNMVNKKSDDYFFNMDFIFKNFDKILNLLKEYDHLYLDSEKLKKFYKIILKFLAQKTNIELSDVNLGLQIDIEEEILPKWKDILEHIHIYKNYYKGLKSEKIHLNEEKIYLSTDIKKEEDIVKNIIDFDNKVKMNLYKSYNITELYQIKTHQNIQSIKKLVMYVDVINSKNIDNNKKLQILTGKLNFTTQELYRVLNSKPKDYSEQSKILPLSIKVAGKMIKLANNTAKGNGISINSTTANSTNVKSIENYRSNALNIQLPPSTTHNLEHDDEVDLFDEEEDKLMNILSNGYKSTSPVVKVTNNNNDIINNFKNNNLVQRLKEPSIGINNVYSTSTPSTNPSLQKNRSANKIIDLNNFNKIKEPNLVIGTNKSTNLITDNKIHIDVVSSNNNNLPKIPTQINNQNPNVNLIVNSPNPLTNLHILKPILPIASPGILNSQRNLLPINNPTVTAVKVNSPNLSYNKNIFKPDAKIDTISKVILGINSAPNFNPSNNVNHIKVGGPESNNNHIIMPNSKISNEIPKKEEITSKRVADEKHEDEDDDLDFGDEDNSKAFIQKKSRISNDNILDIDLSILNSNKKIVDGNQIKKMSLDEIKMSAKKFMEDLKNHVKEINKKPEEITRKEYKEKSSVLSEDNKSLNNISQNSNNLVNLLSNNLQGLDDKFFEIKHNIIMNLIK